MDISEIKVPEEFQERFNDWVCRYCEEYEPDFDNCTEGFDRDAYNEEGWRLAWQLKDLLLDRFIVYRFLLPGPHPRTPVWKEIPLDDRFRTTDIDHHNESTLVEMEHYHSFDTEW